MKHSWKITFQMITWMVVSIIIGLLAAPYVQSKEPSVGPINNYAVAGIIVGLMLVAAFGWYFMMKKFEPTMIDRVFSFGIAALLLDMVVHLLDFGRINDGTVLGGIRIFIVCMAVGWLFYSLYYWTVMMMQKSWAYTLRYAWVSNIFVLSTAILAAAALSSWIPPLFAIIILFAAAVYDAVAVWKLGTMQKMAHYFIKRRLLPGIAIPYPDKRGKFALLGGGDVFFIVFVATSFYKTSGKMVFITAAGMILSVIILFFAAKKKLYPALPFISAGLLAALLIGLFII